MNQKYYIIHPKGHTWKISTEAILEEDLLHYKLVVNESFDNLGDASLFAFNFAKKEGISFVGSDMNSMTDHLHIDTLSDCQIELKRVLLKYNCSIIPADEITNILILDNQTSETININQP